VTLKVISAAYDLFKPNIYENVARITCKSERVCNRNVICFARTEGLLKMTCHHVHCKNGTMLELHCVSKKDTTQPPTIISTIVADSSNFCYKYCWV